MSLTNIQDRVKQYEHGLVELFTLIIQLESQVETQKLNLAENNQFDLGTAFNIIDIHQKGYLKKRDFLNYFAQNRIPVQEDDCQYLITHFNKESDKLYKQEFFEMIVPKRDPQATQKLLRNKPHKNVKLMNNLCKLLELEIEFYRQTQVKKMQLMNEYGWNTMEAFKIIDQKRQNAIDYQQLDALFKRNGRRLNVQDFRALMQRINQDFNDTIEKDEFCDALLPSFDYKNLGNQNPLSTDEANKNYYLYKQQDKKQGQMLNQQDMIKDYLTNNNQEFEFLNEKKQAYIQNEHNNKFDQYKLKTNNPQLSNMYFQQQPNQQNQVVQQNMHDSDLYKTANYNQIFDQQPNNLANQKNSKQFQTFPLQQSSHSQNLNNLLNSQANPNNMASLQPIPIQQSGNRNNIFGSQVINRNPNNLMSSQHNNLANQQLNNLRHNNPSSQQKNNKGAFEFLFN